MRTGYDEKPSVPFEDWEAEQMKNWCFRFWYALYWRPHWWVIFRMWLWKKMHGEGVE